MSADAAWWPLWGCWVAQGLLGPYNLWLYRRRMAAQDAALAAPPPAPPRPVFLIIPVKGAAPGLGEFVGRILGQDYPDYRVLFAVESTVDPAYAALLELLGENAAAGRDTPPPPPASSPPAEAASSPPPPPASSPSPAAAAAAPAPDGPAGRPRAASRAGLRGVGICVAGLAESCGQKVHNQLVALGGIAAADGIIAFADADMEPPSDWLRRLVAPLNAGTHGVSSTYRWLVPAGGGMANHFASVANAAVATWGGPEWYNLAWGGSMAFTREAFEGARLRAALEGSLNDDLQLASAARRAGERIAYVRSLHLPAPVAHTWRSLFAFARRQYVQVRIYAPAAWAFGLAVTSLYLAAWCSAWWQLLAGGSGAAAVALALVAGANLLRARLRAAWVRAVLPGRHHRALRPAIVLDHLATAAYLSLHWLFIASSATARKLTWAGVTYRLRGRQRVEVLGRVRAP